MPYDDAHRSADAHLERTYGISIVPAVETHASTAAFHAFGVAGDRAWGGTRVFSSNNEFWESILYERLHPPIAVSLDSFFIFNWLPRAPGLYFTPEASAARRQADGEVISVDGRYIVYNPYGKQSMLDGGVGCIRLRPLDDNRWIVGASSTGVAHEGIPLLISEREFSGISSEINDRGCVVRDVTGTLSFLPRELSDIGRSNLPQLCVRVDSLKRPSHPKSRGMEELVITAACSFLSEYEGSRNVYSTYVSFDPAERGSYESRVRWLSEEYVGRMYSGRVITDFDQWHPNFGNIPFSLADVMDLRLKVMTLTPFFQQIGLPTELAETIAVRQKEIQIFMRNVNLGNAGIVGDGATNNTINVTTTLNDIDLNQLASELKTLRSKLREANKDGEHDAEVGSIQQAEKAAREGDRKGVLAALRTVGKWTWEKAQEIGVSVAIHAIEGAIGP